MSISFNSFSQEKNGFDQKPSIESISYEELHHNIPQLDSFIKTQKQLEEEQLNEELKSKGLENIAELNYDDRGPVKFYIVLKAFSNLTMAKKYIETMALKGILSLKTISETKVHRVYQSVAYSPEEANKLRDYAKTIEPEAWIFEKPY